MPPSAPVILSSILPGEPDRPFVAPQLIVRCVVSPVLVGASAEYARLITSGFVHADLGHLTFQRHHVLFICFSLSSAILERQCSWLFISAGCCLGIWARISDTGPIRTTARLGASGAILAVMFASIVYFPHQSLIHFSDPRANTCAILRSWLSCLQLLFRAAITRQNQS